jgi:urease accessory protein
VHRFLLWQLIDSAFPAGGFAHSWGLEAAYQAGEISGDAALQQFLVDTVWQTGHAMLPLVNAAHRAPGRAAELDALCEAFLTNAVANRASRLQGTALLSACARIWPTADLRALAARGMLPFGHQGPIAGAALRLLGLSSEDARQMTLVIACRGVLAAAVRLGIVGPYRAQQLQFGCAADMEEVLARCGGLDETHLTQTAPLVDLLQSAHDRLYSRLFQS